MNRPSSRCTGIFALAVILLFVATIPAYGQGIMVGKDRSFEAKQLMLPYVFYNQNFGGAAGFVYATSGAPQKQMTLVATAIAGSNSALALYMLARDVNIPVSKRLFLDVDLALSTFGDIISYTNGNPNYFGQQAGANDSAANNYIKGPGVDNIARTKFRYLLPIGTGKDDVVSTYVMDKGMLVEGAQGAYSWNPWTSGKTYLEVKPFWRDQEVRSQDRRLSQKTNGAEFSIFHDNTDFPKNPSRGDSFRVRYTKDWGMFDSNNPYDVVDVEFSKYFSLGPSENFRQRVIAFDFWSANSPSWDDYTTRNNGQKEYQRAPAWAGATLGGLWRMRAYPTSRFHDQAAIYYALEYRMTPEWNPFEKIDWVKKYLGIEWWQWVPFVEVGRVAPAWDISTLHTSMKWDAGVGVRAMAKGIVIRIDGAASEEGWAVQMMVGQPFNF